MRRLLKYLPLLLIVSTQIFHGAVLWVHTAYENGARVGVRGVAGNQFGFNDPITWELLQLAAPHVKLAEVTQRMETMDHMLLLAVLIAIPFCVPWKHNPLFRWHRRYLAVQLILFPAGWIGLLVLFASGLELVLNGSMTIDGEFFDDGITAIMSHGIWVLFCLWYVLFSIILEKTNPDLADVPIRAAAA